MRFIMPKFLFSCERWKWNADLRLYVSTHGHFKDEHKRNQACKVKNNYFYVQVNGKWLPAHRVVLLTWRPLPVDGEPMTVDHLNSITRDNRLCNLEWVTEEENHRRAEKNFLKDEPLKKNTADCEKIDKAQLKEMLQLNWDVLTSMGYGREKDQSLSEKTMAFLREKFYNKELLIFAHGLPKNLVTPEWLEKQLSIQQGATINKFFNRVIGGKRYLGVKNPTVYLRKTNELADIYR